MTLRTLAVLSIAGLVAWCTPARASTGGQQLAEQAGRPLVGTLAPRLTLETIDGKTIDLGRLYGRQAVYLKFWATWCTPCREQMPHFERAYETAGPDLAVIAIDVGFNDSVEDIREYRKRLGITMPIVRDDGRLAAALHLRVTPQHIVIGRDGRILYVGHLADAGLDAALLAARTASQATPAAAGAARHEAAPPASVRRYGIGDLVPRRSVSMLDGARMPLRSDDDPRETVLIFLSPWCESYLETTRPVVAASCRQVREQANSLAGDHRVRWLGIASGLWATADDVREYRRSRRVLLPLSLDESGALFRAFGVTEVPAAVITDAQGRIRRTAQGSELAAPAALRALLASP